LGNGPARSPDPAFLQLRQCLAARKSLILALRRRSIR
jgi:hypothetical protein